MSRPKDADSAQTYERIVAAARSRLEERGIDALTMRLVARDAQVSTGTLTYYFEDRDALLEACFSEVYRALTRVANDCLARLGQEPAIDIAERGTKEIWAIARQHRELARARLLSNMQRGTISVARMRRNLLPALDYAEKIFPHLAPAQARLGVHSLTLTVLRYAVASEEELALLGLGDGPEGATARIGDHLASLTRAVFEVDDRA